MREEEGREVLLHSNYVVYIFYFVPRYFEVFFFWLKGGDGVDGVDGGV